MEAHSVTLASGIIDMCCGAHYMYIGERRRQGSMQDQLTHAFLIMFTRREMQSQFPVPYCFCVVFQKHREGKLTQL